VAEPPAEPESDPVRDPLIDPGADPLPPLQAGDAGPGGIADVAIVGAGVIGLSIAWRLVRADASRRIVVVDRSGVAAGASRGNAGAFAFSDIQPLASPGLLRQLPRWLADPLGPLSLPPSYLPRIAPWLWRFWRACLPAQVEVGTAALAALNRFSAAATPRLLHSLGAGSMWHEDGNLHLYESEAEWRAALPGWRVRAAHGIAFEHAHGPGAVDRITQWQPGLSATLVAATFVPGWATIDDPLVLVRHLARHSAQAGVALRRADARALQPEPDAVAVRLASGATLRARRVVVAAGAWSHRLAATLGERIPLETERGYNSTLPPGAFALRRQLTFPGHGFVVTPIAGGVRVGGAVELAGVDAPPRWARSDALLAKARRFLPGLRCEGATRWMGCRPSLPDSLPAIGPARADPRVVYAFGHGHLGLTQAAATGELVAALADGQRPALDLAAFRAGRF
jgi:D-amino-acid dehydrogenase